MLGINKKQPKTKKKQLPNILFSSHAHPSNPTMLREPIAHTAPHQLQPTTNQQRFILKQQQQQIESGASNSTFFSTLASIFKPSSPPTTQVFSMATVPEQTMGMHVGHVQVDRSYVKSQGLRSGSPPLRRVDSPWIYDWRSSLIKWGGSFRIWVLGSGWNEHKIQNKQQHNNKHEKHEKTREKPNNTKYTKIMNKSQHRNRTSTGNTNYKKTAFILSN